MKDRAYEIAINPKYEGYEKRLAITVCAFFDTKTGSGAIVNEVLVQELYKSIIKKNQKKESLS